MSFLIPLALCAACLLSGCSAQTIEWPSDFIGMGGYTAETDKTYKKAGELQDEDRFDQISTLKGLPKNEYLCYEDFSLWGGASKKLYMSPDVREPILRYDVYKIAIPPDGEEPNSEARNKKAMITDSHTIERILALRANGDWTKWDGTIQEQAEDFQFIRFYFDLPCKLTFDGKLYFMENGTIYWECFSVADETYVYFDITYILEPLFADT